MMDPMNPMAAMGGGQNQTQQTNDQISSDHDWTVSYIPEAIYHNYQVVNTSRIVTSLIAGCAAGILGITGYVNGAAFYLIITFLTSLFLAKKSNFDYKLYFVDKKGPLMEGLFKGVMV